MPPSLARTGVLALLLAQAAPARGGEGYVGRVVAVADGRTLTALVDQRRMEVRIAGIDAPLPGQRYAIASRQSLIAICGGEPVRIEPQGRMPGGVIARVFCDGRDAGREQVRRGMATASGTADAHALDRLQADARAARRGVWSVVPPDSAMR